MPELSDNNENQVRSKAHYVAIGLVFGVGIGTVFGAVFGNVGLGVAFGTAELLSKVVFRRLIQAAA